MAPSKKKKFVGDNALLLAEWNWEKNQDLSPHTVRYGSAKRVWWLCSVCGNEWETPAYSRGSNGCGCPECGKIARGLSKQKNSAQKNSFLKRFPEIAEEWHPTKNKTIRIENVSAFSNVKAWWLCSACGKEWETTIEHRTKEGTCCPACSKVSGAAQKVKTHARRNNFARICPKTAEEWHPFRNGELSSTDVSVKSNKKVWWQCRTCGYEWQTTVNHRAAGQECPNCSMAQTSFAEQAIYFYVSQIFPDAIHRYKNVYEFDVYIPSKQIAIEYDGYYYHSGKEKLAKDNLKDRFCNANGIMLFRFRSSRLEDTESAIRITCEERKLEKGLFQFFQKINELGNFDVDINRDTAQIQQQFRRLQKENSIATKRPELLKEWHLWKNGKISPYTIAPSSALKIWWQCRICGYEWQDTPNHRSGRGSGCPLCAGRVVVEGVNDLSSRYPMLAGEWDIEKNAPLLPTQVACSSNKKVWWKCQKHGHEWQAVVSERTRKGHSTNCPYCGNKKVLQGFNDLATLRPDLAAEWDFDKNNIQPTEVSTGSKKRVWWLCNTCGYEWQAVIYSRKTSGCPRCAKKIKKE